TQLFSPTNRPRYRLQLQHRLTKTPHNMSPPAANPFLADWQLWSKGPEALLAIEPTILIPDESGNGFTASTRIPAGRRILEDPTVTLASPSDALITEAIYVDSINGPSIVTSSLA